MGTRRCVQPPSTLSEKAMRKLPRWVRLIGQSLSGLSDHYMDVKSILGVRIVRHENYRKEKRYTLACHRCKAARPSASGS